MNINVGNEAPDFELNDSRGQKLKLSSLRGKKVVLYFFPKAFTTGCTIETKKFADLLPSLTPQGVEVVGISVDEATTQQKFAESCHATFPIVGDADKSVAKAYGVLGIMGYSKRVTFFVDEKGIVTKIVESMLPGPHIEAVEEEYVS